MWETVGTVAVLLLALYGCMEGLRRLAERLLHPPCKRGLLVLPFSGHCEEAEFVLRCAAAHTRGMVPIVAVDAGADAETRRVLEAVAEAVRGIEVVAASTFCERFF